MIKICTVSKRYNKNSDLVLKNISFEISRGKVLGVLGPNGSGKTTLLKIIVGFLKATSGEIYFEDLTMSKERHLFKNKIKFLPADSTVFGMFTPREILRYILEFDDYPKEKIEDRITQIINQLNMLEYQNKKASEFSTGMKKLLSIASVVVSEPEVIILDEPTNGLDVTARRLVKNYIQYLKKLGTTIILSTHLMTDIEELCDDIVFINKGNIIVKDSLKNLYNKYQNKNIEQIFFEVINHEI